MEPVVTVRVASTRGRWPAAGHQLTALLYSFVAAPPLLEMPQKVKQPGSHLCEQTAVWTKVSTSKKVLGHALR